MCGLVAVLLSRRTRTEEERGIIWSRFTRLLDWAQARGTDAAGVALIRDDARFEIAKQAGPARALLADPKLEKLRGGFDDGVVTLFGHARRITKGASSNSHNNHPIVIEPLDGVHGGAIGIHNGTIENDDMLFAKYGYPRSGEVDSEIIFHMIAEACHLETRRRHRLCGYIGELRGAMTFVCVLLDEPGRVYVYRGTEPLCSWHDKSTDVIFVCSLPGHMKRIAKSPGDVALFMRRRAYRYSTWPVSLLSKPDRDDIPEDESLVQELTFEQLRKIAETNRMWLMEEGAAWDEPQ